jgi:glycosyltransferase involved in cell wall biosynthesis
MTKPSTQKTIAVLIPCYQEEKTIGKVVKDFQQVLPQAAIYVFDNNCTDRTAEIARAAGAIVRREKRQGKGFVVASMFEQVDADIYVMVDGDDTYDAKAVDLLLQPILKGDADMTVACRLETFETSAFRNFHIFGNRLVCGIINWMFKSHISDIFSGYRAFTREAAKVIPVTAVGFDVETELTLQALYRGLVLKEVQAAYGARPEGSFSKLKTGSDGLRVLMKLFLMVKSYKPLTFFGSLSIGFMLAGLLVGIRPVLEFIQTHYIRAVPSAILASSLVILSFFSLGLGLILNSVNLRLLEVEKLIRKWDVKEMASSQRSFGDEPAADK